MNDEAPRKTAQYFGTDDADCDADLNDSECDETEFHFDSSDYDEMDDDVVFTSLDGVEHVASADLGPDGFGARCTSFRCRPITDRIKDTSTDQVLQRLCC
jgi:hypothetical protein